MARKPSSGPTERELDILRVLWEGGEQSVREIHEHFEKTEGTSFTSVQTMLQIMFEKGLVDRSMKARTFIYRARTSEEETQRTLLANLLDRAFGGSAKALVSRALDIKPASKQELAEIQELLEEAQREVEHD